MKLKACFVVFLSIVFFTSCASHKAARQPDLSFDLQAQENKVENNGIVLMVKVFHLKSELKSYFDDDLLLYGILPVQMNLHNKSYGKTVLFNTDGINLMDPTGARNPVMSLDQVMDKVEKSFWRTAGWGVAFGCLGAIPSAINVDRTNEKIRADYESRILKSGNLISGGVTEGLIYFSVPEDITSLSGWKICVILKDMESREDIILDYGLSGTIVSPKERIRERNEAVQEATEKGNM